MNSPCGACVVVDWSAEENANGKSLEKSYQGNLDGRPLETRRTLDAITARRKDKHLNEENFVKFVDQYKGEFNRMSVKIVNLRGVNLANDGGWKLLEFINCFALECLKSVDLSLTNISEGALAGIKESLAHHPVGNGSSNCFLTLSDGELWNGSWVYKSIFERKNSSIWLFGWNYLSISQKTLILIIR